MRQCRIKFAMQRGVQERIYWIDAIRGAGMLVIIIVHTMGSISLLPIQYLFSACNKWKLGIFFTTSGLLLKCKSSSTEGRVKNIKQVLCNKYVSVIKPYLLWSLIMLGIYSCFFLIDSNYISYKQLWIEIYDTLVLNGVGVLWFLPVLVISEIIYSILKKKTKMVKACFTGIALLLVELWNRWVLLQNDGEVVEIYIKPIMLVIIKSCVCVLYYFLAEGLAVWFNKEKDKKRGTILTIVTCICVIFAMPLISTDWDYNRMIMDKPVIDMCASIVVTGCVCIIFERLDGIINSSFIGRVLGWIGRNSLVVMATHYLVMQVFSFVLSEKCIGWSLYTFLLYTSVVLVVTFPLVEPITKYCSALAGRGRKYISNS